MLSVPFLTLPCSSILPWTTVLGIILMDDRIANMEAEVPVASSEAVVPIADAEAVHAWPDFDIEVNPNHPLYLHPSDNPAMNPISTKLTGLENYAIWSRAMIVTLRGKNKISFIDGSFDKSNPFGMICGRDAMLFFSDGF